MFGDNLFGRIFAMLMVVLMGGSTALHATMPVRNPLVGTGDYYELVLDEGGKAYVIERIELHNVGNKLDVLVFRIPADSVERIHVLQVFGPECPEGSECLMVYYENYYLLEVEDMENGFYRALLNKSLETGDYGTVMIYYEAKGYADSGLTNIDFQTTEYWFPVEETRVAVADQNGVNLSGYDDAFLEEVYWEDLRNVGKDLADAPIGKVDSVALSRKAMNLRNAGGFIYETEDVREYETFHVPGHYKKMNDMWVHPVQPFPSIDYYPWPDPVWLGFAGGLAVAGLAALAWRLLGARFAQAI